MRDIIAELQALPVYDLDVAMRMAGGEADLVQDLAETIRDDMPQQLTKLSAAQETQDLDTVRTVAHYIKGGASNVGAERLRAICFAIETAAKNGEAETVQTLLPQVPIEVAALNEAFAAMDWPTWIAQHED